MNQPVLIITGASHGIGAAAALIASKRGAQVVLTARNRANLEQVSEKIIQSGGNALVVEGDISHYAVCKEVVIRTVQAFGRIDAVINNAALLGPLGLIAHLAPDEWTRTLEVNLFGPVLLCREAIPHLRETSGRIVNISSGASVLAIPGGSAYCTSKGAINHFSKILSIEEPSIIVIAFDPGNVNTPMQAEIRERGHIKIFKETHRYMTDLFEQGQLLPPEQSAMAVVTLALAAPPEWTGEFLSYEEERIQNLIRDHAVT